MFVRCKRRFKDSKEHRYWSVVENVRVSGGRVVQRQVLYLGEINDSQRAAWCSSIEVLEGGRRSKQVALFPEDREAPELDCQVVQLRLAELTLHDPRQWGACWLTLTLWERLELDRFWGPRLPVASGADEASKKKCLLRKWQLQHLTFTADRFGSQRCIVPVFWWGARRGLHHVNRSGAPIGSGIHCARIIPGRFCHADLVLVSPALTGHDAGLPGWKSCGTHGVRRTHERKGTGKLAPEANRPALASAPLLGEGARCDDAKCDRNVHLQKGTPFHGDLPPRIGEGRRGEDGEPTTASLDGTVRRSNNSENVLCEPRRDRVQRSHTGGRIRGRASRYRVGAACPVALEAVEGRNGQGGYRSRLLARAGLERSEVSQGGAEMVAAPLLNVVAELCSDPVGGSSAFTMMSELESPPGVSFSGMSGGAVYTYEGQERRKVEDEEVFPVGIVYGGFPGATRASDLSEEASADAFLTERDILIRALKLTPDVFDDWVTRCGF